MLSLYLPLNLIFVAKSRAGHSFSTIPSQACVVFRPVVLKELPLHWRAAQV
jgi:hypothetical protein